MITYIKTLIKQARKLLAKPASDKTAVPECTATDLVEKIRRTWGVSESDKQDAILLIERTQCPVEDAFACILDIRDALGSFEALKNKWMPVEEPVEGYW